MNPFNQDAQNEQARLDKRMDYTNTPQLGFKNFLERAEQDGWISKYRWAKAESLKELREKLGGIRKPNTSRTHKRGTDGIWWGLEVEPDYGTAVGVDIELLVDRPVLQNPQWIAERMGLGRVSNPKEIIEEWSRREAAFKAVSMQFEELHAQENKVVSLAPTADGSAPSVAATKESVFQPPRILISQFKRAGANTLSVYTPRGDRSIQTRCHWSGRWVLSLTWCTT